MRCCGFLQGLALGVHVLLGKVQDGAKVIEDSDDGIEQGCHARRGYFISLLSDSCERAGYSRQETLRLLGHCVKLQSTDSGANPPPYQLCPRPRTWARSWRRVVYGPLPRNLQCPEER